MYQQIERLKFLVSRCLTSCGQSGSSNQYIKINNLPKVMGNGAKIEVNQVSVIVNQIKNDLKESLWITEHLSQIVPHEGLTMGQATTKFQNNMARQALERANGNESNAAKLLGMKRTTFRYYCTRLRKEEMK